MRILVTGGAGYIGSVLTKRLLMEGHDVIVYDKMLFDDKMAQEWRQGCREVVADLMDEKALESCLPFDCCCHLAAVSNDPSAELDKGTTDAINVGGTNCIAELCAVNNIPLIAASTASVYGFIEWECSTEDSEKLNPQSHYGKSKVQMEDSLRRLANENPNWQMLMFRQATVYGWSPRMRYDLVVNTMVKDAFTSGRIQVHGGGECWRPQVSINDVAEAYVTAVNLVRDGKPFPAQVLNLVHKNYRIGELASWIAWCLQEKANIAIEVHHDQAKDTRSYAISDEKANAAGFECPTGIQQEVLEMWSRLEDGVTADVNNPIYYNHTWLTVLRDVKRRIEAGGWRAIP